MLGESKNEEKQTLAYNLDGVVTIFCRCGIA
jgi:hypothetical protein